MTTTTIAHFTISGEGITQIARNLMLDDEPGRAWRIIAQCLHQEGSKRGGEEFAQDILDGKKKLIGEDPHITLTKDNDREYRKQLAYVYAGRVRISGRWYRPIAWVSNFGPHDVDGIVAGPNRQRKEALKRVQHYCGNGEIAIALRKSFKSSSIPADILRMGAVIFESCGELPHWYQPVTEPEKALEAWFSAGRDLDERGHEQCYPTLFDDDGDEDEVLDQIINESEEERSSRREQENEERYRRQDEAREKRISEIRIKVLEQAAGDLMELYDPDADYVDGKPVVLITVPRAPFEQWALGRTSLRHLAAPWNTISPIGMKCQMDDPNHTDWWLGAGLKLDDYTLGGRDPIGKAALAMMFNLQEELGAFTCTVLVDGGKRSVTGEVGKDIAVVPDLHPSRLDDVIKCKGIITEAGGALAHLTQVAAERAIPVMLYEGAVNRLPIGTKITMDLHHGAISVHYTR